MNIICEPPVSKIARQGLFGEPLLRHLFGDWQTSNATDNAWDVPVDVKRTDAAVIVTAALPGVKADDIEITTEDDLLHIKASSVTEEQQDADDYISREVRSGQFARTIRLPRNLEVQKATSAYKDGVLTVTLPFSEQNKPLRIKVE